MDAPQTKIVITCLPGSSYLFSIWHGVDIIPSGVFLGLIHHIEGAQRFTWHSPRKENLNNLVNCNDRTGAACHIDYTTDT